MVTLFLEENSGTTAAQATREDITLADEEENDTHPAEEEEQLVKRSRVTGYHVVQQLHLEKNAEKGTMDQQTLEAIIATSAERAALIFRSPIRTLCDIVLY